MELAQADGSEDFQELKKGRGFVYGHQNQLYNRVKKVANVKYLKCFRIGCDGSAKIVDGKLFIVVRFFI